MDLRMESILYKFYKKKREAMSKKNKKPDVNIRKEKREQKISTLICLLLLCFFCVMTGLQQSEPMPINKEASVSVKVVELNNKQVLFQVLTEDYIQSSQMQYLLMLSEEGKEVYETTNKYTDCDTVIYVNEIVPEAYQIGDILKISYDHITSTNPKVMTISKVERVKDTELSAYERLITQLSVYSEVNPTAVSNVDIEEATCQKITFNEEVILIYSFKSERAAKTAFKMQIEKFEEDSLYLMDNLLIIYKGDTTSLNELLQQATNN